MSADLTTEFVKGQLIPLIKESFDEAQGAFLDKNTSLTQTLANISAAQASRSIVPGGTCIAGHVEHIRFYLKVMNDYMDGKNLEKLDWSQSWLCKGVTESEWKVLNENITLDYQQLLERLNSFTDLSDERKFGGIASIIAHTAFHLGAIRQMLLVVRK